jgi:uncharacterized protein YjiS (DUF1127 family)
MVPPATTVADRNPGRLAQRQQVVQPPKFERPPTWLDKLDRTCRIAGLPPVFGLPFRLLRRLQHRRELAQLDEGQLTDVGINPESIRRGSAKLFPQDWR